MMFQKIFIGILVAALSGVLIVGAINRTEAKSEQVAHRQEAESGALVREEARELWQLNQGQQGQGNRAAYADANMLESGSKGRGQGRLREVISDDGPDDATRGGEGLASVDEWLEVVGAVVFMNEEELVLQFQDGQEMVVECRAWIYALELGFTTAIGHELKLHGFYQDGEFEIGGFEDLTAQQYIMVREENGRPLWAGRWGRGV